MEMRLDFTGLKLHHNHKLARLPFCRATGLLLSLVCLLPLGLGCQKPLFLKPPTLKADGGYVLTYELESDDLDEIGAVVEALTNRLDPDGYEGFFIQAKPGGLIEIELPGVGVERLKSLKNAIRLKGNLEFLILANLSDKEDYAIPGQTPEDEIGNRYETRWVSFDPDKDLDFPGGITQINKSGEHEVLVLVDEMTITDQDFESVSTDVDSFGEPAIRGVLTKEGAEKMRILTSENLPDKIKNRFHHLGIVMDGELLTAPRVMSIVLNRLQITGKFTDEEVRAIVDILSTDPLPVQLKDGPFTEKYIEAGK